MVYDVGETCDSQNDWSATVTLACKWRGGTSSPVFLSAEDCNLRFIWKSSLFCVGPEYCAATDGGGYVYDLDGLMNDTWSVSIGHAVNACTLHMYMYMYTYIL